MIKGLKTSEPTVRARSLAQLTAGVLDAPAEILVSDITLDSRAVRPGALFLACRGLTQHGMKFAAQAVRQGAAAILYEPPADDVPNAAGVYIAGVPGLSRHIGTLADRFFDEPSRAVTVIGVTGTNGKTTCAYLLAQAFAKCGRPAAYVGTLGFGMPGALTTSTHTTSDAVSVHRQLAEMRDLGATCVGMEVSSHALDQSRVDGVRFAVAAFTNLTRDHLDYHGSMEAYGTAKARLFDRDTLTVRVVNIDDAFGAELARLAGPGQLVVTTRSDTAAAFRSLAQTADFLNDAQFVTAKTIRSLPAGLAFDIDSSWGAASLTAPLIGDFNVDNVLTVLGVLLSSGVPLADAVLALRDCTAPSGRMEVVVGGRASPLAIVDYAHTPDALAKALRAARAHCVARLRVVFGCGGDRDTGKRPEMGRIASELADDIILTDDNPRSEDPARIVADIRSGLDALKPVRVEHDRAQAIRAALQKSAAGDVVLIAGKGHEDYQIYDAERRPFSDQQVVRAYFGAQA